MHRTTRLGIAAAAIAGLSLTACNSPADTNVSTSTAVESTSPSNTTNAPTPTTTEPTGNSSGIRAPKLDDCWIEFDEDLPLLELTGEPFVTPQQATEAWKQMTCYSAVVWAPTMLADTIFTPDQALAIVGPYMTAKALEKFSEQYAKYYEFMLDGERLDEEGNLGSWIFKGDDDLLTDYGQASSFIQPWFSGLGTPEIKDFRYRNPGTATVSGDKEIPRLTIYVEHVMKTSTEFDPDNAVRWIGQYVLVPNPEPTPEFGAWLVDDYGAVLQPINWNEAVADLQQPPSS